MFKMNQDDAASAHFRKLGDGDPDFPRLRLMIHMKMQRNLEAIAECTHILRLGDATKDPRNNHAHFVRGFLRVYTGDKAGACADLEKCISLCEGDESFLCEAYFHLSFLTLVRGSKADARKLFDRGLKAQRKRSPPVAHYPIMKPKATLAALFSKTLYKCTMRGCKGDGMLQCSQCLSVRYCGAECQRAHWKAGHKAVCVKASATKESE
jgi:hypothetical protein